MTKQEKLKTNLATVLSPFSLITLFAVFCIVGMFSLPFLSLSLEPAQSSNSLSIDFRWPEASAAMVEQQITSKIEGSLATIKGVNDIISSSSNGAGRIHIRLDNTVNKSQTKFEIATLMRRLYLRLPVNASFPQVSSENENSENDKKSILTFTINGKGSAADIQRLVERRIKNNLIDIQGIAAINISGANGYCWQLLYNQEKLRRRGVTTQDIIGAVSSRNNEYSLGRTMVDDPRVPGKTEFCFVTLKTNTFQTVNKLKWDKVFVKRVGGHDLFLTELVDIKYVLQEEHAYYRINGLSTVNMEVLARKGSNYLVLAAKIKEKLKSATRLLPSGYAVILSYDSTEFLKKESQKILWRTVATFLILLIFVFLVSRQFQYLLIISISLFGNLLIASCLYYLFKIEIHLYSLAAITISMGVMIDNTIVVIDHINHKKNLRILLAVAGASCTTIGAVAIVFFLDKEQQVKLIDFAWIFIINIGLSLLISLLFIPALLQKIPLKRKHANGIARHKKWIVLYNRYYLLAIALFIRFKWILIIFVVLLFGLPVFMLPYKLEGDTKWAKVYNNVIGNDIYNINIRPWVDVCFGGSLRLFLDESERTGFSSGTIDRQHLTVNIKMPNGASLQQMNKIASSFENYLSQFQEIEQFQCWVQSGQSAMIDIIFKKNTKNIFPLKLKSQLESKAILTGLADFEISGIGQAFNNEINTETSNYGFTLQGYNYQVLRQFADQIRETLAKNPRINKIAVGGELDYGGAKNSYEYVFKVPRPDKLLANEISTANINTSINEFTGYRQVAAVVFFNESYTPVVLVPEKPVISFWEVMNNPIRADSNVYVRLKEFAIINKDKIGESIDRQNQQYQIVVSYDFTGDQKLGAIISDRILYDVRNRLPIGYTLKPSERDFWQEEKAKLVWAIVLAIMIVFAICVVLLNSIYQAFAVLATVPVGFIGVFFTSYIWGYPFDEGGYVALIMLCGVSVSSALYILNDYNNYMRDMPTRPRLLLYMKAYSSKIIPVILSRTSVVIGMLPFIFSVQEAFWYPLAMSVTGGVLFSMLALIVFLPVLLRGLNIRGKINW
ncbi:efflux RND transporter permease subunit [Mucilaginibacter psychrotolerans]|uniref:Efflux RND transporter permease subunit n=1 Tax=Mucilaginibacter psychrotolerans TaxID=1524096 RepID=A0A4Y8SCH5_9SPHI|nr:efflux RND transporter permease subunit [Mucilaginibacter psychrotolerans]TFF36134.1 efflux RND transporter permease subunit [Mucilaginibacter psychrotolerans]